MYIGILIHLIANISVSLLMIVSCDHDGFFHRAASRSEYGVEREPVQQASQIQRVDAGCRMPSAESSRPSAPPVIHFAYTMINGLHYSITHLAMAIYQIHIFVILNQMASNDTACHRCDIYIYNYIYTYLDKPMSHGTAKWRIKAKTSGGREAEKSTFCLGFEQQATKVWKQGKKFGYEKELAQTDMSERNGNDSTSTNKGS